ARRGHPGGQRRPHHRHRTAGPRPRRSARLRRGQGRPGLRGGTRHRRDPAAAAEGGALTHDETGWDLEVRPEKMRRWVVVAAVVVMAIHIFAALVLRGGGDTG